MSSPLNPKGCGSQIPTLPERVRHPPVDQHLAPLAEITLVTTTPEFIGLSQEDWLIDVIRPKGFSATSTTEINDLPATSPHHGSDSGQKAYPRLASDSNATHDPRHSSDTPSCMLRVPIPQESRSRAFLHYVLFASSDNTGGQAEPDILVPREPAGDLREGSLDLISR